MKLTTEQKKTIQDEFFAILTSNLEYEWKSTLQLISETIVDNKVDETIDDSYTLYEHLRETFGVTWDGDSDSDKLTFTLTWSEEEEE